MNHSASSGRAGRIALVTGASRGFGRALALEFAARGCQVIATLRQDSALAELRAAAGQHADAISGFIVDLRDVGAIRRLAEQVAHRWGRLDVLVGNAGVLFPYVPLAEHAEDTWAALLDVNLTANWRLIRALDPLLRASGDARVAFVTTSVGRPSAARLARHFSRPQGTPAQGQQPPPSQAEPWRANYGAYAVSKAGLEMLAMTYAAECVDGPVRVITVDPGGMRTGMRATALPNEDASKVPGPEPMARRLAALLLGPDIANGAFYWLPGLE